MLARKGEGAEHRVNDADALGGNQAAKIGCSHKPPAKFSQAVVGAAVALLAETYPRCFSVYEARRKPLKIGIHNDIIAALGGAITAQEIGVTLRFYVGNGAYLESLRAGAWRIDLSGEPVGTVTADEAQQAKLKLAKRQKQPTPKQSPPRIGLAELKAAARRRRETVS